MRIGIAGIVVFVITLLMIVNLAHSQHVKPPQEPKVPQRQLPEQCVIVEGINSGNLFEIILRPRKNLIETRISTPLKQVGGIVMLIGDKQTTIMTMGPTRGSYGLTHTREDDDIPYIVGIMTTKTITVVMPNGDNIKFPLIKQRPGKCFKRGSA